MMPLARARGPSHGDIRVGSERVELRDVCLSSLFACRSIWGGREKGNALYPCQVGPFLSIISSRQTIRNSDETSLCDLVSGLRLLWEEAFLNEGASAEASDLSCREH